MHRLDKDDCADVLAKTPDDLVKLDVETEKQEQHKHSDVAPVNPAVHEALVAQKCLM